MRRTSYTRGKWVFLAVMGVGLALGTSWGQPPAIRPPEDLPPTPVGTPKVAPVVPASAVQPRPEATPRKPAPIERFRKYNELPEITRQFVFATQRGMEWLTRDGIHLPNGRFVPGINPALGKLTEEDHFLRQAMATFALARSVRLTGDEKHAVRAYQSILSLLSEMPKDPAQPGLRKPAFLPVVCHPVAAASLVALAIYELPDAPADLVACAEELCQFVRGHLKSDGSIALAEEAPPAEMVNQYAGPALYALAQSQRANPAKWKQEALAKGFVYYRKYFQTNPHPAFVPWMTAAFAECHLQTKEAVYAEFVFEMNDWLAKLQYDGNDRNKAMWRGGFPSVSDGKLVYTAPTLETALYAQCFADACRMLRQMERPDTDRYARYRMAVHRALQFVCTLQYTEEGTQHFAAGFRPNIVGAFYPTTTDGTIRTEQTAWAVSAFAQFLMAGADQ